MKYQITRKFTGSKWSKIQTITFYSHFEMSVHLLIDYISFINCLNYFCVTKYLKHNLFHFQLFWGKLIWGNHAFLERASHIKKGTRIDSNVHFGLLCCLSLLIISNNTCNPIVSSSSYYSATVPIWCCLWNFRDQVIDYTMLAILHCSYSLCLFAQVVSCPKTWVYCKYCCSEKSNKLVRGLLQQTVLIYCVVWYCKGYQNILKIRMSHIALITSLLYPSSVVCGISAT